MEGACSESDMLYRRQDRLRKEEDGLIRVIRMCNLSWEVSVEWNGTE